LAIAGRSDDSQNQGFQLLDMVIAHRQVNTETVPRLAMLVTEVSFQSTSKVTRKAHVVKLLFLIERIYAISALGLLAKELLVFSESRTGNALKILRDQRSPLRRTFPSRFRHVPSLSLFSYSDNPFIAAAR
jgi:hypothetical protein